MCNYRHTKARSSCILYKHIIFTYNIYIYVCIICCIDFFFTSSIFHYPPKQLLIPRVAVAAGLVPFQWSQCQWCTAAFGSLTRGGPWVFVVATRRPGDGWCNDADDKMEVKMLKFSLCLNLHCEERWEKGKVSEAHLIHADFASVGSPQHTWQRWSNIFKILAKGNRS